MFKNDAKGRLVADGEISTKKLVIPDGTSEIGPNAFKDMRCEEIVIPGSVKRIYHHAFHNCQCKKLTIKDGEQSLAIDQRAFSSNPIKSVNFPSRVWYIGKYSFADCPNLKEIIGGMGIKIIYAFCFNSSAIEEVDFYKFAPLVEEIGEYAFENNGIKKVKLPFAYQELRISSSAFSGNKVKELISNPTINNINTIKTFSGFEKAKLI